MIHRGVMWWRGFTKRRERKIYWALEGQKESDGEPPLAVFRSHLIWMRRRHQKMAATGLGDPSRVDFFTSPPPLAFAATPPRESPCLLLGVSIVVLAFRFISVFVCSPLARQRARILWFSSSLPRIHEPLMSPSILPYTEKINQP